MNLKQLINNEMKSKIVSTMYQKMEIDNKYYNAVASRESQIGYLQKLLAKVVN